MDEFSSKQISKSATIQLNGGIEIVFPLFTPLGEIKWVPGWSPEFLFPESGTLKENLVFKTKSSNSVEEVFNWITSYLNKEEHLVVYTVFTSNRVWTIKVRCEAHGTEQTKAEISYTFTGLNETGNALNEKALEKMYASDLKDWEAAINYFLTTGKCLQT